METNCRRLVAVVKFGLALGRLNPSLWTEATVEAERLGFESVWMPEHLVLPAETAASPKDGHDLRANTPVFDAFAYLAFLAGKTERIRLATHVYNLALRHPFVSARAIATLDVVSGGRAIAGIGAGWLHAEWRAAGLDFATRGARLDEALAVCKRLWTEDVVEHHGEFFDFGPVAFEPKPVQKPYPPVIVGGMSAAALRRATTAGDGWVAMSGPVEAFAAAAKTLKDRASFEISTGAVILSAADLAAYEDAGASRVIVSPWARSSEALDGMRAFAATFVRR